MNIREQARIIVDQVRQTSTHSGVLTQYSLDQLVRGIKYSLDPNEAHRFADELIKRSQKQRKLWTEILDKRR